MIQIPEFHATIIADLLEKASDKFSNHGCNDYEMPNTDENWQLFEEMSAANVHKTVEQWRVTDAIEEEDFRPSGKTIYFTDWWLMPYFADLINPRK